jgi:hypothetical protein
MGRRGKPISLTRHNPDEESLPLLPEFSQWFTEGSDASNLWKAGALLAV